MTTIMKLISKHKRHSVGTKRRGAQRVKEFPVFYDLKCNYLVRKPPTAPVAKSFSQLLHLFKILYYNILILTLRSRHFPLTSGFFDRNLYSFPMLASCHIHITLLD